MSSPTKSLGSRTQQSNLIAPSTTKPRKLMFYTLTLASWTLLCSALSLFLLFSRSPLVSVQTILSQTISENLRHPSDLSPIRSGITSSLIPSGNLTAPDALSLAVILPVTNTSLVSLDSTLSALLSLSGDLSEIVLVTSSYIQGNVRLAVQRIISEDSLVFLDVSISLWPDGLEEGAAVLYVARTVQATRILFLDTTGLDTIDLATREMLVGTFSTLLPVGPRGFGLSGDYFRCILPEEDPQASAFLVPPFSISNLLVPPHDLDSHPVYDIWSALGQHISRARFERVGGVVASRGNFTSSWCTGSPTDLQDSSVLPPAALQILDAPIVAEVDSNTETFPDVVTAFSVSTNETMAIVFSSIQDIVSFGSAICGMLRQGYLVEIIATQEVQTGAVGMQRIMLNDDCYAEVVLPVFRSQHDPETHALTNWFASFEVLPEVIVYSSDDYAVNVAVNSAYNTKDTSSPTIIRIPRNDLRFSDWMGSLTIQELRNWHQPQLDISIITNDRPKSLSRLLTSLTAAFLFGDTVNLRINLEQTADVQTLRMVDQFPWAHGAKVVHRRVIHGGLLPAIVESWYPSSDDSYGLILEDDVELSPLFYAWIKLSLLRYRYGRVEDVSPGLFGISLYQQKNLELRPEGRHRFNARKAFASAGFSHPNTPYLSQIPCSWGAVYFPEHWREFHEYLTIRLSGTHPMLPIDGTVAPGLRSNKWTRSWKKYFIELVFLRGYVMLYPNYKDYASLSTNHLEVGSHVKDMPQDVYERKKKLFMLPLMELPREGTDSVLSETGLLDLPGESMPSWEVLPVTDLLGMLTTEGTLQGRGKRRREELLGCDSLDSPESDIRELLCVQG